MISLVTLRQLADDLAEDVNGLVMNPECDPLYQKGWKDCNAEWAQRLHAAVMLRFKDLSFPKADPHIALDPVE